jgi:hypothetical protein
MNPSQHVTTLRQTHRTATTLLPVLTATLTVAGAVIAAMESRSRHASAVARDEADELAASTAGAVATGEAVAGARIQAGAGRVTLRGYIATLVGRMLLVALGIALVLSLVYVASASGQVGRAILLTALILLALYLTEKVARR